MLPGSQGELTEVWDKITFWIFLFYVCFVCVFQMCLQMFQLLPEQVVPLVFSKQKDNLHMREILEFLINIILGHVSAFIFCKSSSFVTCCRFMVDGVCQVCNRDTRLLAGTAVAMLISVAPDNESGTSAASSLLQITNTGEYLCTKASALHEHQERYDPSVWCVYILWNFFNNKIILF